MSIRKTMSIRSVTKIATEARQWAEEIASTKISRNNRCFERPSSLGSMCGVASAHLALLLLRAGQECTLCEGDCHMFVVWNDHMIDITATQFEMGYAKVYVQKVSKRPSQQWWKIQESWKLIPQHCSRRALSHRRVIDLYSGHCTTAAAPYWPGGRLLPQLIRETIGKRPSAVRRWVEKDSASRRARRQLAAART